MLRGLRKASSNWLGKAVMAAVVGFLVISFAIWGIGDIFRGFGRSTVAKIGRTEITIEQFRNLYNERLQQYARQFGRPITPEQARAIGLDRLLLRELAGTIASGLNAPKPLIEAMNRYQNEQRSIEYVLLDRAQAGDIPAPSPEEL